MNKKNEGFFISLEGGEGCGKTTQAELLKDFVIKKLKRKCLLTKEPGGTNLGKAIRNILLDSKQRIADMPELLLFLADRLQHLAEVIIPALNDGKIVICDRYADSTIAYQVFGKKLDYNLVNDIIQKLDASFMPNLTILLNVGIKVGLKRATLKNKDRFESYDSNFHKRVNDGYLELFKQNQTRIKKIDVENKNILTVHQEIIGIVKGYLFLAK